MALASLAASRCGLVLGRRCLHLSPPLSTSTSPSLSQGLIWAPKDVEGVIRAADGGGSAGKARARSQNGHEGHAHSGMDALTIEFD